MNLDLKSVELFVRVASLGAIGKAGAEFGISPTAATQRIQALETALGSKLLNRTTRIVSLSADGTLFLAHAKRIIADIEDAVADLQATTKSIRGEIRVTASASFGRRYIAPFIGEFLNDNPEVTIHLELSDSFFDIVHHGYDLALRIGVLAPSMLMAQKIAPNPRILVASPDYLENCGTPQLPNELSGHNCIILGENHLWGLKRPNGSHFETRVSGNFRTNYGEAVTEAALAGVGIALKSKWDILQYLSEGRLLPVLQKYTVEPEWNLWAVRPPGRNSPVRVKVFTQFIENKFRLLMGETPNMHHHIQGD